MSQCLQASLIAKYMDSLSVQKMRKACGCISIPLPATTCNFQHEGVISIRKTAMGLSETYQRKMDWFHEGRHLSETEADLLHREIYLVPKAGRWKYPAGVPLNLQCYFLTLLFCLYGGLLLLFAGRFLQLLLCLSLAPPVISYTVTKILQTIVLYCRLLWGIKIAYLL